MGALIHRYVALPAEFDIETLLVGNQAKPFDSWRTNEKNECLVVD